MLKNHVWSLMSTLEALHLFAISLKVCISYDTFVLDFDVRTDLHVVLDDKFSLVNVYIQYDFGQLISYEPSLKQYGTVLWIE